MATKNTGILYKKVPKFQIGSIFAKQTEVPRYSDADMYGDQIGNTFGKRTSNDIKSGYDFGFTNNNANKGIINPNTPIKNNKFITPEKLPKGIGYNSSNIFNASVIDKKPALPKLPSYSSNLANLKEPEPIDRGKAINDGAQLLGTAGAALEGSINRDGDPTTYTKGDTRKQIGGSALKGVSTGAAVAGTVAAAGAAIAPVTTAAITGGAAALTGAAAGSVVPIIGTAVGLVVGAIVGIAASKKAKKKAAKAKKAQDIQYANQQSTERVRQNSIRDTELIQSIPNTSSVKNGGENTYSGYRVARRGGTFHFTLKTDFSNYKQEEKAPLPPKKFKRGGSIKATENIIPNGVLHEEKNKLGDKGMPVVKCNNNSCVKKYEIERDEMIFTLATTKEVERLIKQKDFKKLGLFVKTQVLDNTHSFTDKYADLNTYKNNNESIYN